MDLSFCFLIIYIICWTLVVNSLSEKSICQYPCQCPAQELICDVGVTTVKDGCGCCYMCARQQGDICSVKDLCDGRQGLYCDFSVFHFPGTGICKANASKPCLVNGVRYVDGEKFKPDCSRLCTCQNGNYGCTELCQDEYRIPSEMHCQRPRLLEVSGQCCKQWTCDLSSNQLESAIQVHHIELNNANTNKRHTEMRSYIRNASLYQNTQSECQQNESSWTPCSTTCGSGVSKRKVTDRYCQQHEETRLCIIRPCKASLPPKNRRCTATARLPVKQRIKYEHCVSVDEWSLKFCTNCKRRRCCYPKVEETRKMEFQCGNGKVQVLSFMWIKSCRCDRECYYNGNRKRRHNKG